MSSVPSSSRPQTPAATNALKHKRGNARIAPSSDLEAEPSTPAPIAPLASVPPFPSSSVQHRSVRDATSRSRPSSSSRTPSPRKAVRKAPTLRAWDTATDTNDDNDDDEDDFRDAEGEDDPFDDAAEDFFDKTNDADDDDGAFEIDEVDLPSQGSARTRRAPSRTSNSNGNGSSRRPQRSRGGLTTIPDDEGDGTEAAMRAGPESTPAPKQSRRLHRKRPPKASSEGAVDDGEGLTSNFPLTQSEKEKRKAKEETPEEEVDEEAKKARQTKREEEEMVTRWTEEYYEIVDQLPLEINRSLALLRELESQMNNRLTSITRDTVAYRDARLELHDALLAKAVPLPPESQTETEPLAPATSTIEAVSEGLESGQASDDASGAAVQPQTTAKDPIDAQAGPTRGTGELPTAASQAARDTLDTDGSPPSVPLFHPPPPLTAQSRLDLLHQVSRSACEAVRAGEEKVGLAVTTYEWIDRQCRRLDADLRKIESSLVLGLRTGTEESRGLREAQGLTVDGDTPFQSDPDAEAEESTDSPAVGVMADDAESTVKSNTTSRLGGYAALPVEEAVDAGAGRARRKGRRTSGAAAGAGAGPPVTTATKPRKDTAGTSPGFPTPAANNDNTAPKAGGDNDGVSVSASSAKLLSKQRGKQTATLPETTSIVPGHAAMAIDPNEPRYCYCDQPSFDEMVACDNDDCPREWFHYGCVGLTATPKGKWFCRFCTPPNWKGPGTEIPLGAKFKPSAPKAKKKKG